MGGAPQSEWRGVWAHPRRLGEGDAQGGGRGKTYAGSNILGSDGIPVGRICHARGANLGFAACLDAISVPVGDIEESLRRVPEGSGNVMKATGGADRKYAYAVIEDPVGVCLALVPG